MKNLVRVIWTGRLYYLAATLAWVLPLWLVNVRLSHNPAETVMAVSLAVYLVCIFLGIMVENLTGKSLLATGVVSSIGSFMGLTVFVLLRPYNSLSLTWLIAVVCGIIASMIIFGLISWFENEMTVARNLENLEEEIGYLEDTIFSALILDWLVMSIALPIFMVVLVTAK